ncbi:hypothetical protein THAOC_14723, partial [Thalassiosira oceanica]
VGEGKETDQIVALLSRLKEEDPAFDYRISWDARRKAKVFVWQDGVMRKHCQDGLCDVFMLDMMKRQQNSADWPYCGPVLITGENKAVCGCEAILKRFTLRNARRRRSSFVRSSKSFVTSSSTTSLDLGRRPPARMHSCRASCWRSSAEVALPKSIAEPYPAQTSIHPLSDDFPRLIGRGPGDGRYRDRAEPAEMSVHPRGVGQSHPDPSLQHQASQVPTNGERFRATPNLSLKVGET